MRYIFCIIICILFSGCSISKNEQLFSVYIKGLPLPIIGQLIEAGITITNKQAGVSATSKSYSPTKTKFKLANTRLANVKYANVKTQRLREMTDEKD